MIDPRFEIRPLPAAGWSLGAGSPEGADTELRQSLHGMTFPVYRPLLQLAPTSRHPEQGDPVSIQPVAVVAWRAGAAVGLALGELPLGGGSAPELLSLFVAPEWRGRGIGTALVGALEAELVAAGGSSIETVYTEGKPSIAALERVLWKRGWPAPRPRTLSVRFAPEAFLSSELFSERRMAALDHRLELFSWSDLSAAERVEIRASDATSPWITPALAHWRFELAGFDPVSSLGARYRGQVVGWVINHQVAPGHVRFTCSFLRKDLSRRGRIVPLYRESLRRLVAAKCRVCTLVTPVEYPNMIHFIVRWIAPIAEFVGQTRGSRKELPPSRRAVSAVAP